MLGDVASRQSLRWKGTPLETSAATFGAKKVGRAKQIQLHKAYVAEYYAGVDVVLYMYDTTSQASLDALRPWVLESEKLLDENCVRMVVGTKVNAGYRVGVGVQRGIWLR